MDFDEDADYLDIDDIMAQTQVVKCKFLFSIPGLEFLQSSGESIKQGTEVMLPFWMAKTLYSYSMIDIILPEIYDTASTQILEADPTVVDLSKTSPHYYRFGKLLAELKREKGNNLPPFLEDGRRNEYRREEGESFDAGRKIANSLINTFNERQDMILEFSTNQRGQTINDVRQLESRMDSLEKRLFQTGREQAKEMKRWESRDIEMLSRNFKASKSAKRPKVGESSKKSDDNA